MPTKQELQAEIDRLRSALEAKTAVTQPQGEALTIGETYLLNIGEAQITDFYDEDGHQKVRFILQPLDPFDGATVLEDRESVLMSTPVEKFHRHIKQFELDQIQREALAHRPARRIKVRKGKRV